ncbi:MAG: hypothetical protein PHO36_15565 [Parabacteroides sp.]|nr:hypothetical protein [Parabacteroides sp.]
MNDSEIKIGSRFKDKNNGDKATVVDIFTAYPNGIETLLLEAKFDVDVDTCVLDVGGFDEYYEII